MPETKPVVERRYVDSVHAGAAIETREDGSPRIVGYAAVYYDGGPGTEYQLWDDLVERIMPGAFDDQLGADVLGLFNHSENNVLGRTKAGTMVLSSDTRGLRYEILPPDTSIGRDVTESLKRGDVAGSSFAFIILEEKLVKADAGWIREIHKVQLIDVGPVTFPAYTATTALVRKADVSAVILNAVEVLRLARFQRGLRARIVEIENQNT